MFCASSFKRLPFFFYLDDQRLAQRVTETYFWGSPFGLRSESPVNQISLLQCGSSNGTLFFGKNVKSIMPILNIIGEKYLNQNKPNQKYFLKFGYFFIKAVIGWCR